MVLRTEHKLLATLALLALGLGMMPPLRVAGMPMWFYLTPVLLAAYCVSLRAYLVTGVILIALAAPLLGQASSTFFPVAVISYLLAALVALLRHLFQRTDTLLVSSLILLLFAYPVLVGVYFYVISLEFLHATLLASRYVVQCLMAIIIAEAVVLAATLSDWRILSAVRTTLGFRPSLVQVAELIASAAVTLSLVISLVMFWRGWEQEIGGEIRDVAMSLIESRQAAAAASVEDRMATALMQLEGIDALETDPDQRNRLAMRSLQGLVPPNATGARGAGLAVFRRGQLFASADLTAVQARAAQVASQEALAGGKSLVAVSYTEGNDNSRRATSYQSANDWMLTLVFNDLEATDRFEYSMVTQRERGFDSVRLVRAPESVTSLAEDYAIPPSGVIVDDTLDSGVVWQDEQTNPVRPGEYILANLSPGLTAAFRLTADTLPQFVGVLHGADAFRAQVSVWDYYLDFAQAVSYSTFIDVIVLLVLLLVSRLFVGKLIEPIGQLTRIFESWRQFRGGELGSGAALQAMDSAGMSALRDLYSLQQGFRALAQDVMYGERRLSTIAANYDELLRSLPLGVLAVDGASRVQFLNDALGEMTAQRQDALQRLKAQAAHMLANGSTVDEWQLVLDGAPPKSLLLVVNHRLDERGQESGLWVIVTDLTEQKQTSAQLIQASKLATLGEMSTGMAHELNQPLNVISLATSNLRFTIKKGKATPENTLSKLDRIDGAVHRAANIIDHMRAYGRLAGEGLSEINIGEVVGGACNLLGEQLKLANIALLNEVPEDGLVVQGNAIQLEQVLINLVNNAKDAIKESGDSGAITIDSKVERGRVQVRVTDTGGGIPDHVLPHIFEPFFTTKPVGKGTGLGGSISYGIIREMQGDIWAENVNSGAQITISLPLVEVSAPALDAKPVM
jgi:signal transduction histidine kinase